MDYMKAHKCIIAKMYTIFRWKMHRMNVRVTRVIESIPVIALPVERKVAESALLHTHD